MKNPFRRHRSPEATATIVPDADNNEEHETPLEQASATLRPVGETAARAALDGFMQTESGLLVPDSNTKIEVTDSGNLVVDRRRVTPEKVEADLMAEQERLRSPLDKDEIESGISTLFQELYLAQKTTGKLLYDADSQAMFRLTSLLEGDFNSAAAGFGSRDPEASIDEQLAQLVQNTADGQMANEEGILMPLGYHGHTAYVAVRMKDLYGTITTNPEQFRTLLSEAGADTNTDPNTLHETFLSPLEAAASVPRHDGSRSTPPPTAPIAYGRWIQQTLHSA